MSAYTETHARSQGERPPIEVWPNQYPQVDTEIEILLPEFTCHCPKTGQPDFATLRIVRRAQGEVRREMPEPRLEDLDEHRRHDRRPDDPAEHVRRANHHVAAADALEGVPL